MDGVPAEGVLTHCEKHLTRSVAALQHSRTASQRSAKNLAKAGQTRQTTFSVGLSFFFWSEYVVRFC